MDFRIESDTIGPVNIPVDALWGAQTQRSRQNFKAGNKMPLDVIRVLLIIKRSAAVANCQLGKMTKEKSDLIVKAVDTLLRLENSELRRDFPLRVYQTGSGTQTNMNVNEVIAHMAKKLDASLEILPNDDVNMGQSSNDVFPTAMNIAAMQALKHVIEEVQKLTDELKNKQRLYWETVKIGRTHLQDATPLTFGQEISGWVSMLEHDLEFINSTKDSLYELPLGGTAVGTGLNTTVKFTEIVNTEINNYYHSSFNVKNNKFYGLAAHSAINAVHGTLKTLAADLLKIANDVRFLASGPRAGYGELNIPANEPGSSIMPGKVNPTQAEALTMAAVRVIGNDTVISVAASQGNFEMNVYKPLIIDAFLESVSLLTLTVNGFNKKMIAGMTVNEKRMGELVDNSLMTVTALSPHLGYHKSAEIAQKAQRQGISLREAALESGEISESDFDQWVDTKKMTMINPE
ncbi:class II fumarate hydratase [Liquorilactobacillus hordei]|uniref:Fumarate hydratase class II n=1 Tax=Liquorilactobacillus hordei DSM 19519 TaxID=1423759 RepID=A0A0R1M7J5_9LACO|nr:class II fumarate hydratase [Liquorilactobacillus hordei]KRL04092.1 fumarate hydratase [Liquorilactobacillus hordei DSM 19519]QYH51552.1 class II fumarate hydratase [Liquorilactobacillus hordei DSM 19519]